MLRLFNVSVTHFALARRSDRALEIQNVLARLGALDLFESEDVLPSERLADVHRAVAEALASGVPRLITALAPVLVRQTDRLSLARLQLQLVEAGLGRRLGWLVENTLNAIRQELAESPPRPWAQTCRRAALVLETFRDSICAARAGPVAPDLLDPDIRTRKSLHEVRAASSPIAQKWGIITSLQADDFARVLSRSRAPH